MKAKAPHGHKGTQRLPMLGIAASAQHEFPKVFADPSTLAWPRKSTAQIPTVLSLRTGL